MVNLSNNKLVYCVVEGQTEKAVFNEILRPYINNETKSEMVFSLIKSTKQGGIAKFDKILPQLRNLIKRDKNKTIVTTFFDYYGIHDSHDFKFYNEAKVQQKNALKGVCLLEKGMTQRLNEKNVDTRNFIPYIQLHEFEALLFSSDIGFKELFDNSSVIAKLNEIRKRYPNPENINDDQNNAPSKRILKIVLKHKAIYQKESGGLSIAKKIGIHTIMEKCPRFNKWVNSLVDKINE